MKTKNESLLACRLLESREIWSSSHLIDGFQLPLWILVLNL